MTHLISSSRTYGIGDGLRVEVTFRGNGRLDALHLIEDSIRRGPYSGLIYADQVAKLAELIAELQATEPEPNPTSSPEGE